MNARSKLSVLVGMSMTGGALLTTAPAQAQETLEPVTVTATKRGETLLQETPLSITAFSAAALENAHIEGIRDLGAFTPGLTVGNNASWAQLYIRGVGSNNVFPGSDPSTTVHVDGVYMARPMMVFAEFVDLERVEVLRGPQGTLYGRNSAGGTINLVTRLPADEVRGSLSAEFGDYGRQRFAGSLSGPLVAGRLMAGIAAMTSERDGYVDNIHPAASPDEVNDEDIEAVRAQLRFRPTEAIDIVLSADYYHSDDHRDVQKAVVTDVAGNLVMLPPPFMPAVIADPWTVSMPGDASNSDIENQGVAGKVVIDLPGGQKLTSITAYRELDFLGANDSDWTEIVAMSVDDATERQHQFSQELQLVGSTGRLDWLFGLYYLTEKDALRLNGSLPLIGLMMFGSPALGSSNEVTSETDAWAGFAQGTFAATERLSVTAGLRYSHEEKSIDAMSALLFGGVPLPFGGFTQQGSADWDAWTPKFGLDYRLSDDSLLYLSVTRGFKSGGFNFSAQQPAFAPEFLWAYEVGIKSEWADRRLRLNASAFRYDYSDMQVQGFVDVSQTGGAPRVELRNAAEATVQGLELELTAVPVRNFELYAGIAWLDATYDEFMTARSATPNVPLDAAGNRLNYSPEWKLNLAARYEFPVGDYGTLALSAGYNWQDEVFFSQFNDPAMSQGSFGLANARVAFTSRDGHWQVAVFGTNLGDEAYYTAGADWSPLGVIKHINPPRMIGARVGYTF
jgi:iron complex outermembrane receptor protein